MVDVKNGKQQSDLRLARIDFSWWCIDIDSNDLYCATCSAYVKDHNAMRNCPKCGEHHDRDVNAAVNILYEGLRMTG